MDRVVGTEGVVAVAMRVAAAAAVVVAVVAVVVVSATQCVTGAHVGSVPSANSLMTSRRMVVVVAGVEEGEVEGDVAGERSHCLPSPPTSRLRIGTCLKSSVFVLLIDIAWCLLIRLYRFFREILVPRGYCIGLDCLSFLFVAADVLFFRSLI